jgi:PAS domain S-box/diguanylate cyclase (GGDEF) domain
MDDNFKEFSHYKYAIENIHDIVWELDPYMNFTFVGPNAKELSGYEADEMLGRNMLDFLTVESRGYVIDCMQKYQQKRIKGELKETFLYDVEFNNKNGSTTWFEVSVKPMFKEGIFVGYIGTTRDISDKKAQEHKMKQYIEELESNNRKLDQLATYDMLTGVYNRRKFEQEADLAVEQKVKYGLPFSIIMFDIDGFKLINDQYGHRKGDVILQEAATTVKQALRENDRLFRWGGDEFIILLQSTELKNAFKVAEKVRKAIEIHRFEIEEGKVTISLGVGEYVQGDRIDQFLSHVDNALLKAKSGGKNKVEFR